MKRVSRLPNSPCREVSEGLSLLVQSLDYRLQLGVVPVEDRFHVRRGHPCSVTLSFFVLRTKWTKISSVCAYNIPNFLLLAIDVLHTKIHNPSTGLTATLFTGL